MKRHFLIGIIVLIAVVFPAAAQEGADNKKAAYYYVNTTVEKIYPYRKGYVIQYRKGLTDVGRLYLPVEWFTDAASKGEIVHLGRGTDWPSLSIYYKDGEFSHVRLYVRSLPHDSWGNIPLGVNLDSYFENVDEVHLEY
ncbi:MAG: hypothetical protein LBP81_04075 [Treponema sp.]|jgi:hypothetical protein|nr:hypothetical protein [Treponema sp.]